MLNIEQVKARYGVTKPTIYRWMAEGIFPQSVKIGGAVRWREEDLDAFDRNSTLRFKMKLEEAEEELAEDVQKYEEMENAQLRGSRLTQIKQKVGLSEDSSNYQLLKRVEEMVDTIEHLGEIVKRNE